MQIDRRAVRAFRCRLSEEIGQEEVAAFALHLGDRISAGRARRRAAARYAAARTVAAKVPPHANRRRARSRVCSALTSQSRGG